MSTNYTTLIKNVPVILLAENRTLVDNMDQILIDAQDQIMGLLDHDAFRVSLPPMTLSPGDGSISLQGTDPQILEVRSLGMIRPGYSNPVPLERRDINYLQMVYPKNIPGVPRYYGEYGSFLDYEIYPTPSVAVDIIPEVNQEIPYLEATTQETNLLTNWYPRVIEKTALYQGALFMKDQSQIQRYDKEMTQAILEANAQIQRRKRDNTGLMPVDNSNTGT